MAEHRAGALDRHAADELDGSTLAAALDTGICVLAGPHAPHVIPGETDRRLATDLRRNGVTVIADLSAGCLLGALAGGVDFCKSSEEDVARTAGFDPAASPSAHLDQIVRSGAANAALTRGAATLLVAIGGRTLRVTTPELVPVDHRGAGDAFTALVAASRCWGLGWDDAVRWGAAAGSLTVVRRGLATAGRREIRDLVGRVTLEELDAG